MTSCTKGSATGNFTYRSDGLRAGKEVGGGTKIDYIYDGQTVIGEVHRNSGGTVTKKVWYTPGPNGYINRTETDASDVVTNKEWFVYDGLGSCRAMVKPVNNNGTWDAVITARYDYDVYGKVRTSTGATDNKFKYVGGSCGHPTDDETGLIYMRARYYDPSVGRFIGEDPGMHNGHWYMYANANPSNCFDANGQETLPSTMNSISIQTSMASTRSGFLNWLANVRGIALNPGARFAETSYVRKGSDLWEAPCRSRRKPGTLALYHVACQWSGKYVAQGVGQNGSAGTHALAFGRR